MKTGLRWSRLRQGTLLVFDVAGNTGHGCSRLRSGREEGPEEEEDEEEAVTDIKSNNPHLTGGIEKYLNLRC